MARRKQRSASAASASSVLSPSSAPCHRRRVKVMSTPRAPPAGEEDSAFVRPTPSTFPAEEEDEKRIVIFIRSCAPSPPVLQGESPFHRCVELLDWSYTELHSRGENTSHMYSLPPRAPAFNLGMAELPSSPEVLQLH